MIENQDIIIAASSIFSDSIKTIQSMPEFFDAAVKWGIDASYKAMGFIALMVLILKLFK